MIEARDRPALQHPGPVLGWRAVTRLVSEVGWRTRGKLEQMAVILLREMKQFLLTLEYIVQLKSQEESSNTEGILTSSLSSKAVKVNEEQRIKRLHRKDESLQAAIPRKRGISITPDKYDGSTSWIDYCEHFESCRAVNGWSGEEAGKILASCLRGQALRLLREQKQRMSFNDLKKKLANRFSDDGQAENHLLELKQRQRYEGETLKELGQNIRELTSLAYPELDYAVRERLAKGHFMDALTKPKLREAIFNSQDKTLDEVIHVAVVAEAFHKSEDQRMGTRGTSKYRGMTKEEEMDQQPADPTSEVVNTLISLKEEIVGLVAALKGAFQASKQTAQSDGKQQREKSAVSDGCCFYCGKKGHIKKKCRKRLKSEAQRQTEQHQQQISTNEERLPQRGVHGAANAARSDSPSTTNTTEPIGNSKHNREMHKGTLKGMYIPVIIAGQQLHFLVDTGATDTYISKAGYVKLIEQPSIEPTTERIMLANGSNMKVDGKIHTEVTIGQGKARVTLIIADVCGDGVLGMDNLLLLGAKLDLETATLETKWGSVQCRHEGNTTTCFRMVTTEMQTVPASWRQM